MKARAEGLDLDPETIPDVRDLRAFCLVADLGSITAAASALGETKGTVSRRLTRLEKDLGVSLLRRSPRLVQPSDAGVAYRAQVGRALDLLDDANAQLREGRGGPRGNLRVTAPNDLAVSFLAPMVARFLDRFPEVTIDMVLAERRLDFDLEQIDVAFRASPALEDSSLVAHKLRDIHGRLYASPAYLAAHGTPMVPDDLASHRLLVGFAARASKTLSLHRLDDPAPVTVRIHAAMSATNYAFAREVAGAGAGIAVLPAEIVARDLDEGRLVPVLPDHVCFSGSLCLIHHGARFLAPKVRAFRDHVLAELGRPPRRPRG